MGLADQDIENLLAHGESSRVERKETLAGAAPTSIREAICAFANDLPGSGEPGLVFVGVRDNGDSSSLAITDEMLRQLADMKTDGAIVPPPSMFVERRAIRGADVAVVTVLPSDSPPVRYKGAIHVRVGPRKGLASAQDERILNERRRFKSAAFDVQPIPGARVDALNLRLFEEDYLPAAFSPDVLSANDRSGAERLAATKMISSIEDETVTVLGLLVLGKRPRDYLPNDYIQFLRIDGLGLSDAIVDADTLDGTLADVIRGIDARMRSHIRTRIDIASSDVEQRAYNYPLAALQQIVRNAVMHRTYEATNAPVRVTWFNDRIEIWSPGGPFGVATRENFGRPGVTDYRNPNLAEAMKVMGFVQRFGVGISIARKLLRDAHHPDIEFRVDDNYVQAVIRGTL